MRWVVGEPWPTSVKWKYPRPQFRGCLGGPITLVEILDEDEFASLGYQTTGPNRPQIPDFLGRTRSREWVLYESKSVDHLDEAVRQLAGGLEEFTRLRQRIDKLGIALNVVQGNEPYYVVGSGLLAHKKLMPGGVIRLSDNGEMPIMVEVRGSPL